MALNSFWTQPPTEQRPPKLRRWQLLVLDALEFYEHTPGGATVPMLVDYIHPRLSWIERKLSPCYAKAYVTVYALVDAGWIEEARGEAVGEHGGVRYSYRIVRVPNGQR